jgi:diaminopimelate decarboxylase
VLIEPGRGLAEPTVAILTRVLEVRPRARGERDVIVDAAVSDLPDIAHHPHRMFSRTASSGQWQPIATGSGQVLGRSCMESDVLATGVALTADVAVGDYLAVADAGAYDASKSYVFGCG